MFREVKPLGGARVVGVFCEAVEIRFLFVTAAGCGDPRSVEVRGETVVVVHLQDERLGAEWLVQSERVPGQDDGCAVRDRGGVVVVTVPDAGRSHCERTVVEVDGRPALDGLIREGLLPGTSQGVLPVGTRFDQGCLERGWRLRWLEGIRGQAAVVG